MGQKPLIMGQKHVCRSRPAMHGSWSAAEIAELLTSRKKTFHPPPEPLQAITSPWPRTPSETQEPQPASAVLHEVLAESRLEEPTWPKSSLQSAAKANATHPKGMPSGQGSPCSWPHHGWVGFCPQGGWTRDGDCSTSSSLQPGHGLEVGVDCP